MAAIDSVEWEACLLEPVRNPDTERVIRKALGMVPPSARYFLDSPGVIGAYAALNVESVPMRHVASNLLEMIALAVSQENSCRYCYTATRSLMKILGFGEERIRRLEEGFTDPDLGPLERSALEFARCVSRAAPLASCSDGAALVEAGWSTDAIKEIAFIAAGMVFFNRIATFPALPPDEMNFGDRWYVRLFRPLIASRIRVPAAKRPIFLQATEREGPFASFVNALDGLPAAPRLRAAIDAIWASSALNPSIKSLVCAVVARGIGSPDAEAESVRLLVADGRSPAAVERMLAHLSAPDLDPMAQAAALLARESIWYRPIQLQRQAQAVRSHFTREQFVELIGVAALANAIARLGVVVDIARQAA